MCKTVGYFIELASYGKSGTEKTHVLAIQEDEKAKEKKRKNESS